MNKLDNRGFTLVEVLAVLVILIAIMSIAIPSISSSLERNKDKQDENKKKVLESAAELYVTDHKNSFTGDGLICIGTLKEEGYVTDNELKKSSGNVSFDGCIIYTKIDNSYSYSDNCSSCSS